MKRRGLSKKNANDEAGWLRARRALLRHVKSEVRKRVGEEPADVRDFAMRYERELSKPWTASSQAELLIRIEDSNLVFGGDFHALAQAQRTHLRLLRNLDREREVILALECFQISAQAWLDAFIARQISLTELRAKSKWDRNWGFPWDHYRPLLELARERGFRLVAVNSKVGATSARDLSQREAQAAKAVVSAWARTPEALVYVLFGDLHLSPTQLPAALAREIARKRSLRHVQIRDLTIHLNSERVYFQLAKKGLELKTDVVKFSAKSYCVLSTPPWVKWQSYLLFLDRLATADAGSVRLDDEVDFDPTDQVALLVRLAAGDLGLKNEFLRLNDLAVYGEDDETIWRAVSRRTEGADRAIAQSLLRAGQPFFLPRGGLAYLPKPTINAAASVAGLYLHARLSGRIRTCWKFPGDLRASIWIEAVSYFISKLVNHSRRSETLSGLQTKLQDRGRDVEALRLALDIRLSEMSRLQTGKARPLKIRPRQKSSYLQAARILGGMLGERLYLAYRSRKLKRELLVSWLKTDPGGTGFSALYEAIVEQIA